MDKIREKECDSFREWLEYASEESNNVLDENKFETDNEKDYAEGYADAISDVLGKLNYYEFEDENYHNNHKLNWVE